MPKRFKNQVSKKGKARSGPMGSLIYKGRVSLNPTLAIGANVVNLNPAALDPTNLANFSDTFEEYAFQNVKFELMPPVQAPSTPLTQYVLQYTNEVTDTPGTTITGAMFAPYSKYMNNVMMTPQYLNVPSSMLLGENTLKAWRTFGSILSPLTSNVWQVNQGAINLITPIAGAVFINITYTVKFMNAVPTAATPMRHRTSLVYALGWEKNLCIDMYLPGTKAPFPSDLDVDVQFKRMADLHKQLCPANDPFLESQRLTPLFRGETIRPLMIENHPQILDSPIKKLDSV